MTVTNNLTHKKLSTSWRRHSELDTVPSCGPKDILCECCLWWTFMAWRTYRCKYVTCLPTIHQQLKGCVHTCATIPVKLPWQELGNKRLNVNCFSVIFLFSKWQSPSLCLAKPLRDKCFGVFLCSLRWFPALPFRKHVQSPEEQYTHR